MGPTSVAAARGRSAALRTVRHDGTPDYRYRRRPGLPPVSVTRLDSESAHAELPPGHRHAHEFLVLVYVEQGTGSFTVAGAARPLGAGEVHALSSGQVVGLTAVADLARGRAWSVAFTPDAVPALAAVSPLVWSHQPTHTQNTTSAGHGRVAEPDRAVWSAWLTD